MQPAQNFTSGSAVSLGTIGANVARINIFSVGSGLAHVGGVTFETATRSSELIVFLGQGVPFALGTVPIPEVANNWGGLNVTGSTQQWIRLSAGIAGDLTGPVFADTINRLQIGGVQGGAINASGTLGDALDIKYVRAFRGEQNAPITTPGAVGTIEMTIPGPASAIQSDVVAGEFIQSIDCAGVIGGGSVLSRPSIIADGIGSIAASELDADVDVSAGAIGRIEISNASFDAIRGSILAASLGNGIDALLCNGGSRANITVGDIDGAVFFGASLNDPSTTFRSTGVFRGELTVLGRVQNLFLNDVGCIRDAGDPAACDPTKRSTIRLPDGISQLSLGDVLGDPATDPGPAIIAPFIGELIAGRFWGYVYHEPSAGAIEPAVVIEMSVRSLTDSVSVPVSSEDTQPGTLLFMTDCNKISVQESIESLTTSDDQFVMGLADLSSNSIIRVGDQLQDGVVIGILTQSNTSFEPQIVLNASNVNEPQPFGPTGTGSITVVVPGQDNYVVNGAGYPYSFTTTAFGGGAVGVVPFDAHVVSSDERNIDISQGWPTETDFNSGDACSSAQLRGIQIDMYGPVFIQNPALPAFTVERNFGGTWVDLSPRVVFETREAIAGAGFRRIVVLRGKPGYGLPRGTYRVTPTSYEVNGVGNLVCDQLLTTALVPVSSDLSYEFTLQPDCNTNCIADANEPGPVTCNPVPICDPIDFNNDAVFPDDQDLIGCER